MQLEEDEGSISPLIFGFFTVIMLIIFLISNIAHVYIERRSLISKTEGALLRSAQELDAFSYYYGNSVIPPLGSGKIEGRSMTPWRLRVPIDCNSAQDVFRREVGTEITIDRFQCDGYELRAVISRVESLPFQIKIFGLRTFTNRVEIGVTSHYQ